MGHAIVAFDDEPPRAGLEGLAGTQSAFMFFWIHEPGPERADAERVLRIVRENKALERLSLGTIAMPRENKEWFMGELFRAIADHTSIRLVEHGVLKVVAPDPYGWSHGPIPPEGACKVSWSKYDPNTVWGRPISYLVCAPVSEPLVLVYIKD